MSDEAALREALAARQYAIHERDLSPTLLLAPDDRKVVLAKHHATLLRALDEAMVVLKDLTQSRGWLLGDTERVSVALDNADAIIARYEEAKR